MFFKANPVWAVPSRAIELISRILQDHSKSAEFLSRLNEEFDGFLQSDARGIGGNTRTGHIERHGMSDKLLPFAPDLHRIVNLHNAISLTDYQIEAS